MRSTSLHVIECLNAVVALLAADFGWNMNEKVPAGFAFGEGVSEGRIWFQFLTIAKSVFYGDFLSVTDGDEKLKRETILR